MKLFALIHCDHFGESHDLYGIFSTREKARKVLKEEVPSDERDNGVVRIVEYEIDTFVPEGHSKAFEVEGDLQYQKDLES